MSNQRTRHGPGALGAAVFSGLLAVAGSAGALDRTYTDSADFGPPAIQVGVQDTGNQLELSAVGSTFPVMWIANAGEDTVSKIDTDNNCEIARYRTFFDVGAHDAWSGPAPSRTAVDGDGNVYVANRHFDGRRGAVMKILTDGYIDRNGNGVMDTSHDANGDCQIQPSEVIPLVDSNGNGLLDPDELADERVVWFQTVGGNNGVARALCIGNDGNIWVGLFNAQQYWKLDKTTGAVLAGPVTGTNLYPYGCLVDGNGHLWSADRGGSWNAGKLGEFDTNTNTYLGNQPPSGSHGGIHYSITLGQDGKVYLAIENQNLFRTFDPATHAWAAYGSSSSRGISVDGGGKVVLGRDTVQKLNPTGGVIWSVANPVGWSDQRGVLVDSNNDVWVVNLNHWSITKFRGTDGAHLATLPVGRSPYTYSDATGFGFRNVTNPSGSWSAVFDGGVNGIPWDRLTWNTEPEGNVPAGATLTLEARADDNAGLLGAKPWTPAANGAPGLGVSGRYIGVRATLQPNAAGESPVFSDLTVSSAAVICDVDGNFQIDILDVRAIMQARNQPALPGDPRDSNGDGVINANDARACVLQCTNPRCAP